VRAGAAGFLPQRFISVFLLNKLLLVIRCLSGRFPGLLVCRLEMGDDAIWQQIWPPFII
jgi:hypothetical protein